MIIFAAFTSCSELSKNIKIIHFPHAELNAAHYQNETHTRALPEEQTSIVANELLLCHVMFDIAVVEIGVEHDRGECQDKRQVSVHSHWAGRIALGEALSKRLNRERVCTQMGLMSTKSDRLRRSIMNSSDSEGRV